MAIDRDAFMAWIHGYERSWRNEGTEHLRTLFTEDAGYRHSPYEETITGLPAIARDWEDGREGHDEVFTMSAEIIAIDGNTGVARVEVTYGEPMTQDYLDLWIVHFGPDGRATLFEEWPFWPDQPWTAKEH